MLVGPAADIEHKVIVVRDAECVYAGRGMRTCSPRLVAVLAVTLACTPHAATSPPEPQVVEVAVVSDEVHDEPAAPADEPVRESPDEDAADAGPEPVQALAEAGSSRVPVVRVSPVTVGPKHSPEVIRRVICRADFSRCRGESGAPVSLRFTIGAGGVVRSAEARGVDGQISAEPAHMCLVEVLRGLKFPTDMAGLIVSYPLR